MIMQSFDSKISYIIFLHDYLLACEISTIRTLALNKLLHPLQQTSNKLSEDKPNREREKNYINVLMIILQNELFSLDH